MHDPQMDERSWRARVTSTFAVGLLALLAAGCTNVEFARSPIEQSDHRIAEALAGVWHGTRYGDPFRTGEPEPFGKVALKTLPNGKSLAQWMNKDQKASGAAIISWTEHNGNYLGFIDGIYSMLNGEDGQRFIPTHSVMLLKLDRDGQSFIPMAVISAYMKEEELRASLERHAVEFRLEDRRETIVIDDTPEKMLRWIRAEVDSYQPDYPSGYAIFRRDERGSAEMVFQHPASRSLQPVVAPKPR